MLFSPVKSRSWRDAVPPWTEKIWLLVNHCHSEQYHRLQLNDYSFSSSSFSHTHAHSLSLVAFIHRYCLFVYCLSVCTFSSNIDWIKHHHVSCQSSKVKPGWSVKFLSTLLGRWRCSSTEISQGIRQSRANDDLRSLTHAWATSAATRPSQ